MQQLVGTIQVACDERIGMNILQVTNAQCAPMSANDNTGINRVVSALSNYYANSLHYTCFHAYFQENPRGQLEAFTKGIKLTIPVQEQEFKDFLMANQIEIMVMNMSVVAYIRQIPLLNRIAHECGVKTVYSIHFMPGFEACSYVDSSLLYYNLVRHTNIVDTLRKWVITETRPLVARWIQRMVQDNYSLPLESCDKVVVLAKPYIQRYLTMACSEQEDKLEAIHNPMPFVSYMDTAELCSKTKEVLIVGRLYEPTKRLSYALRVWKMIEQNASLKDWKLTIIGEGASEGYYKWLAKRYGLKQVNFVGRQNPEEYYKRASILLSTSAHEGWPMVLVECMPQGVVPCVLASYESASEIIDHQINGIVTQDNNLQAFYSDLKDMMLNDTKRIKMAAAAIEKSKYFEMESVGSRWQQLFLSLQAR